MLLTDRLRDAWRLVWRALFPEADWLRARYGVETTAAVGGNGCCTRCGCCSRHVHEGHLRLFSFWREMCWLR